MLSAKEATKRSKAKRHENEEEARRKAKAQQDHIDKMAKDAFQRWWGIAETRIAEAVDKGFNSTYITLPDLDWGKIVAWRLVDSLADEGYKTTCKYWETKDIDYQDSGYNVYINW